MMFQKITMKQLIFVLDVKAALWPEKCPWFLFYPKLHDNYYTMAEHFTAMHIIFGIFPGALLLLYFLLALWLGSSLLKR